MSRPVAFLKVLFVMLCWTGLALAARDVRLVQVTTARSGDQLVCSLRTEGLPGEKQLQSMRSGLVSSVELDLALVDEDDRILGGNSLSLRMGFDLWDEVFSVRAEGGERRFQSLADLEAYLADLSNLPVAPSALLEAAGPCRLRVGLVAHSIAPDEQQRVEDVIAGEQRPRREGQDQQEASVSLGRLIRIFYKGGHEGQGGHELVSDWFTGKELPDAAN
jgi:hypothetical protein